MSDNLADNDQAVRELAYFLWEKAGRPSGQEHAFWAKASQEIEGDTVSEGNKRNNRFVAR